jgi:hypothetical protein
VSIVAEECWENWESELVSRTEWKYIGTRGGKVEQENLTPMPLHYTSWTQIRLPRCSSLLLLLILNKARSPCWLATSMTD